jgi:ATP-dependent protease Clp ATPase subunit
VRKLIAGPTAFICDECVDICTDVVEPDDDRELFRLMKGTEESGRLAYPALLDLARRMPTEELAHYVERGRKGVKRSRVALQDIERRLAMRDLEAAVDQNVLATMQQKAQRELKQYEDALNLATTVLGERRQ